MSNYLERVQKEFTDLQSKIEKLEVFLRKPTEGVNLKELLLLYTQLTTMKIYLEILRARINNVCPKSPHYPTGEE